ncbi:MAG: hypothetical protein ACI93R_002881, partial [Flavobacteriales bacterium]
TRTRLSFSFQKLDLARNSIPSDGDGKHVDQANKTRLTIYDLAR